MLVEKYSNGTESHANGRFRQSVTFDFADWSMSGTRAGRTFTVAQAAMKGPCKQVSTSWSLSQAADMFYAHENSHMGSAERDLSGLLSASSELTDVESSADNSFLSIITAWRAWSWRIMPEKVIHFITQTWWTHEGVTYNSWRMRDHQRLFVKDYAEAVANTSLDPLDSDQQSRLKECLQVDSGVWKLLQDSHTHSKGLFELLTYALGQDRLTDLQV